MKRSLSFLLAFIMLVSMIPMSVMTALAADSATISVEKVNATPDSTVEVAVYISDNPGIASMGLTLTFDEDLTLVGATNGEAFSQMTLTPPAQLKKGGSVTDSCRFAWLGSENVTENGAILHLEFAVAADADLNKDYAISITCAASDVLNEKRESVSVAISNGKITVIDYIPGDVDGDGVINMVDVLTLCQYYVDDCQYAPDGYGVNIRSERGDVDANGKINMIDVLMICQYYVDGCQYDPNGYAVKLLPGKAPCEHDLEKKDGVDPTCTKDGNIPYWHCTKCGEYYSDANATNVITLESTVKKALGHDIVIDPAVPATRESTGLTEGSHCERCNEVFVKQNVIPIPVQEEYAITYNIANGDAYLAAQTIDNPNAAYYSTADGYTLKNISVPGYRFLGWYDLPSGSNAVNIKKIAVGEKGEVELYAHWEKIEYTVQFKSNLIPVDSVTYTVDKGIVLPTPQLSGYSFTGWSNGDGKIVDSLPAGTLGDTTLMANWLSERNKAWAKKNIGDPIIIEDEETNSILFTYEIGRVENVPLFLIQDFGYINEDGVSREISTKYTEKISDTMMTQAAQSIANSTTNSSQWSLSSGWSKQVSVNENYLKENNMDETTAKTIGTTDSSNWLVSTGSSGSTTTTKYDSSQDYDLKTTTGNTKKYNVKDDTKQHKQNVELDLDYKYSADVNIGVKGLGDVGVSSEVGVGVSGGYEQTNTHAKKTGKETDKGSNEQKGSIRHTGTDTASVSGWSNSNSYGGSKSVNSSDSFSKTVSEKISSEYGYGKSYINTGEETNLQGKETSTSSSNSYTAAITYSVEESTEKSITYSTSNTKTGYHRLVMAGTAHVFAVVGYNIETASYFISTYTVMDDEMHSFEDYSYQTAAYDDNQNGVIPFEVPYEVEEYVLSKIGETEGLEFNTAGIVTEYTGTEKTVIIPEYHVMDNRDGTKRVIKVTGISSEAFAGNTDITGIVLSAGISEVPANAFKGCSSLTFVNMPGITTIGKEAFKSCSQIDYLFLSNKTKSIGENAFENINTFGVYTDSLAVIEGAINSGAKNIYIFLADSIAYTPASAKASDRKELNIDARTEGFVLNGCGNSFDNVIIRSDASRTVINNITLTSAAGTPLSISSAKVQLGQVNASSSGITLMLTNDNCDLSLYGESKITSTSGNGLLCRNVTVSKSDDAVEKGVYSELEVNGNILKCGQITNDSYIKCNGSIIDISEDDYAKYVKGMFTVTFNANGGTVAESSRVCYYGSTSDKLPVPERTGFAFGGWYTAKDNGDLITEDTISILNRDCEIFAHWLPNAYTVKWTNGTGYTISVKRTASPNKNATIGALNSGATVYFGDKLEISYTAADYYHIVTNGKTSIVVDESFSSSNIFATAELNPPSSWIKASELPANAQVVDTKYTYTKRNYTTGSSSSMSGWTKYDTKRTSWGATQGPVYSNPSNGSRNVWDESYVTSSNYKTVYHYYCYAANNADTGGDHSYTKYGNCVYYRELVLDYELPYGGQLNGNYLYNSWWYWKCSPYTTQQWVSDNYGTRWYYQEPIYTYYFYKDTEMESATSPTGSDISNIQRWVKYREK